ncbi:MAG: response regulator [Chloroflexi bacterium]|nr:response regulator [Chloroflexota bacterium]
MGEKILVVDDDPGVQRFLRHALENEGYQVLSAENGLTGLLRAREERPDLTVLDVMLPGLDGLEVCHRLKADEATARGPVLMLSAKQCETDRDAGDRVGADKYLVKPIDLEGFLETVKEMLGAAVTA